MEPIKMISNRDGMTFIITDAVIERTAIIEHDFNSNYCADIVKGYETIIKSKEICLRYPASKIKRFIISKCIDIIHYLI